MSNQFEQIKRDIMSAMKSNKPRTEAYDTTAEVLYEDDDALWVRIPGGVGETPVEKSIAAKTGDIVQVRVANGRAWINGNNTAPPTDDTQANHATAIAQHAQSEITEQKEYFYHDENGAHVQGENYRNDLRSDGMHIMKDDTEVAKFGVETVIRTSDGTELVHFGYDEGSTSANDEDIAPYYTFGSRRTTYIPDFDPASTYAGGAYVRKDGDIYVCIVPEGISAGAWDPSDWKLAIGNYSFAQGEEGTAAGYASFSENGARAIGSWSHAENQGTAFGTNSHAEGLGYAWELYSHAGGKGTIAASEAQRAIGKYNVIDDNDVYGLIMGKGVNQSNRSNAFGIPWDGDYEFALDSTAATGTTDGDLYAAISGKSWDVSGHGNLVSLKKILTEIINAL